MRFCRKRGMCYKTRYLVETKRFLLHKHQFINSKVCKSGKYSVHKSMMKYNTVELRCNHRAGIEKWTARETNKQINTTTRSRLEVSDHVTSAIYHQTSHQTRKEQTIIYFFLLFKLLFNSHILANTIHERRS